MCVDIHKSYHWTLVIFIDIFILLIYLFKSNNFKNNKIIGIV